MLKRIVVAAMLLASPLHAQAAYTFSNFQGAGHTYSWSMDFSNINKYGDATIVTVGNTFSVNVSDRVKTFCGGAFSFCGLFGFTPLPAGPVQTSSFTIGGNTFVGGSLYQEDCGVIRCFNAVWQSNGGGILGCQLPAVNLTFVARTCAGDGFTGHLHLDVSFTYESVGPIPPPLPGFDQSDFSATFTNTTWPGPSITAAPEPSTYALMAFGLVVMGVVGRRRA